MGATNVIDRHDTPEGILSRIRAIVGDELIYAYDVINPPAAQNLASNALSSTKRGKLARLRAYVQIDDTILQAKEARYGLKNVQGSSHASPELSKAFWKKLPQYFIDDSIKASEFEVIAGLDMEPVNEALDRYRDGKRVVKPHVHISQSHTIS